MTISELYPDHPWRDRFMHGPLVSRAIAFEDPVLAQLLYSSAMACQHLGDPAACLASKDIDEVRARIKPELPQRYRVVVEALFLALLKAKSLAVKHLLARHWIATGRSIEDHELRTIPADAWRHVEAFSFNDWWNGALTLAGRTYFGVRIRPFFLVSFERARVALASDEETSGLHQALLVAAAQKDEIAIKNLSIVANEELLTAIYWGMIDALFIDEHGEQKMLKPSAVDGMNPVFDGSDITCRDGRIIRDVRIILHNTTLADALRSFPSQVPAAQSSFSGDDGAADPVKGATIPRPANPLPPSDEWLSDIALLPEMARLVSKSRKPLKVAGELASKLDGYNEKKHESIKLRLYRHYRQWNLVKDLFPEIRARLEKGQSIDEVARLLSINAKGLPGRHPARANLIRWIWAWHTTESR